MKKKKPQILLNIFFIALCGLIIIPFLLVIAISFSNEKDIVAYGYQFLPKHFDMSAYKYIFANPSIILNAYKVTIIFSVVATALTVLLTAMVAYPLSQKVLRCRNMIAFYLYFTCLFSGGLVPTYILIAKYLNLTNNIWVYILPSCVAAFNVFMMRTFFSNIPEAIIESALIDGANDFKIFTRFILPLSKPVLATIGLLTFLAKWNDWYTSLLYIDKPDFVSLQYLLQRILNNIELIKSNEFYGNMTSAKDIPSETVRMAMAVVVAGPALVVFPFFQKYFVKGLTVGSVKG